MSTEPTAHPPANHPRARRRPQPEYMRMRHGLYSSRAVIAGESEAEYVDFRHAMIRELQPSDPIECALVDQLVQAQWRLKRLWTAETGLHRRPVPAPDKPFSYPEHVADAVRADNAAGNSLLTLSVQEVRLTNIFHKAFSQLERRQETRRKRFTQPQALQAALFSEMALPAPPPPQPQTTPHGAPRVDHPAAPAGAQPATQSEHPAAPTAPEVTPLPIATAESPASAPQPPVQPVPTGASETGLAENGMREEPMAFPATPRPPAAARPGVAAPPEARRHSQSAPAGSAPPASPPLPKKTAERGEGSPRRSPDGFGPGLLTPALAEFAAWREETRGARRKKRRAAPG